tara:strand:+ start:464 stop:751 length:288 start_codon:yes stop_codon:yes gene_type:complete
MTPIEYIINALHSALDNAHDMGMRGGWASEAGSEISASQYAISTIIDDICSGHNNGYPKCGYLEVQYDDADNEVQFTIAELRPVLTQALVAFLQN